MKAVRCRLGCLKFPLRDCSAAIGSCPIDIRLLCSPPHTQFRRCFTAIPYGVENRARSTCQFAVLPDPASLQWFVAAQMCRCNGYFAMEDCSYLPHTSLLPLSTATLADYRIEARVSTHPTRRTCHQCRRRWSPAPAGSLFFGCAGFPLSVHIDHSWQLSTSTPVENINLGTSPLPS